MTALATPQDVLAFWREAGPEKWFTKSDAFDSAVREKFLATYEAAAAGKLADWETQPESTLALLIAVGLLISLLSAYNLGSFLFFS